jgi:hypothetical protein
VPSTTTMLNPESATRVEEITKKKRQPGERNELLALACGGDCGTGELMVTSSPAFVDSEEHGLDGAACMSSCMVMEREEGKNRNVFGSEQLQS